MRFAKPLFAAALFTITSSQALADNIDTTAVNDSVFASLALEVEIIKQSLTQDAHADVMFTVSTFHHQMSYKSGTERAMLARMQDDVLHSAAE